MARPVAVRVMRPWYWRVLLLAIPLLAGYALAYWQFSGQAEFHASVDSRQVKIDNSALSQQLVLAERQLQVERATRSNATREMAALQDEILRLKEDVAFYKDILDERGSSGIVQLHSVQLAKGTRPGEYHYQILLVQSGRHDKLVKGRLRLALQAIRDGKSVVRAIGNEDGRTQDAVSFKYYQRIGGTFHVPADFHAQALQVEFSESDKKQALLTKTVKLPV